MMDVIYEVSVERLNGYYKDATEKEIEITNEELEEIDNQLRILLKKFPMRIWWELTQNKKNLPKTNNIEEIKENDNGYVI